MPDPRHSWPGLGPAWDWGVMPKEQLDYAVTHPVILKALEGGEAVTTNHLEPQPTYEDRVERCELMGMVFCTCNKVEGQVLVFNPSCKVHNYLHGQR